MPTITSKKTKTVTPAQVRKLPWPEPLLRGTTMNTAEAYQVGRLIVERVLGGAADKSKSRKDWSVRRISEELGASSPATITRAIQVYEMANELGLKAKLDHVSTSLLFMVAGIPSKHRKNVVAQALKEHWTRNEIRDQISKYLPERRRRAHQPAFLRALRSAARMPLLEGLNRAQELDGGTKKQALKQAGQLIKDLQRLKQRLS
jgi:hypothetical protein